MKILNATNKPVPHKWAEVIKAWADGETIQWRRDWGQWPTEWAITDKPDFNCETIVFRVHPKFPTVPKKKWKCINKTGETAC